MVGENGYHMILKLLYVWYIHLDDTNLQGFQHQLMNNSLINKQLLGKILLNNI